MTQYVWFLEERCGYDGAQLTVWSTEAAAIAAKRRSMNAWRKSDLVGRAADERKTPHKLRFWPPDLETIDPFEKQLLACGIEFRLLKMIVDPASNGPYVVDQRTEKDKTITRTGPWMTNDPAINPVPEGEAA